MPTYLQFASQPNEPVYDLGVSDFMTMMPGMSYANSAHWGMSSNNYGGTQDFFHSPPQACSQAMPTPSVPTPQPHMHIQPPYIAAASPNRMAPPSIQSVHELPIRNMSHVSHASHASLTHLDCQNHHSSGPFRPSSWQFEPDFMHAGSHLPLKTAIFKK